MLTLHMLLCTPFMSPQQSYFIFSKYSDAHLWLQTHHTPLSISSLSLADFTQSLQHMVISSACLQEMVCFLLLGICVPFFWFMPTLYSGLGLKLPSFRYLYATVPSPPPQFILFFVAFGTGMINSKFLFIYNLILNTSLPHWPPGSLRTGPCIPIAPVCCMAPCTEQVLR